MAFQACIQVCPKNPANFNVDNVRVAKLVGGGLHNSSVVRGLVLKNDAIGSIKKVEKAKVNSKLHTTFILCFC
jgi:T-complex protein 1 subunit theta